MSFTYDQYLEGGIMEDRVGPVEVLHQRQQILDGVAQLGRLCNWSDEEIQELLEQVWTGMVEIDNSAFKYARETGNEIGARDVWTKGMTDLQYWLSLVLGVEVAFET